MKTVLAFIIVMALLVGAAFGGAFVEHLPAKFHGPIVTALLLMVSVLILTLLERDSKGAGGGK